MADVRPIEAVHYELGMVGGMGDVVAPPYDVITPEMRKELLARSPFNVGEVDLPEAPDGGQATAITRVPTRWRMSGRSRRSITSCGWWGRWAM